jgi:hypothetical protein
MRFSCVGVLAIDTIEQVLEFMHPPNVPSRAFCKNISESHCQFCGEETLANRSPSPICTVCAACLVLMQFLCHSNCMMTFG